MIQSSHLHPTPAGRVVHQSRLTRRQLLRAGAGVVGAACTLGTLGAGTSLAAEPEHGHPRPVPGGMEVEGRTFHVYAPSEPGPGNEPSTLTDFVGSVGIAEIAGEGMAGDGTRLVFDVDMRFASGHFVDLDGRVRRGTFGFL